MSAVMPLLAALNVMRVDLSSEKRTQADIAAALERGGFAFEREVRLAPGDVIDFMVEGFIGIEVKLRGAQKKAVFRQLQRYAAHDRVRDLVFASNLSMGLPETIGGKPVWFVALGRAWL